MAGQGNTDYYASNRHEASENSPSTTKRSNTPERWSDQKPQIIPRSLKEFREREGRTYRKERLHALWQQICSTGYLSHSVHRPQDAAQNLEITADKVEQLRAAYEAELFGSCGTQSSKKQIGWTEFKSYALAKEVELWNIFHNELDINRNGRLEIGELDAALRKSNIVLSPATLEEFMTFLTASPHPHAITFSEFRDFFLLLPRKISPEEIYRYYQVAKFLGDDGRGAARVTMEGDVSLSAEDKPPVPPLRPSNVGQSQPAPVPYDGEEDDELDPEHDPVVIHHTALKFLLAGGIAGAISRTCTAPFDRLKIFLITRPQDLGIPSTSSVPSLSGVKAIGNAITRIYAEGGLLAFWTGNGLSVVKIFPESAIKFFAYESSKRAFAKYWDHVEDSREISGVSRFLSGGMGGISSQLSIYPIETLKTQMMSSTGQQKRTLIQAAKHVWTLGGFRAYYRGLSIGLVGVFPYSAIDMSTFEALKLAYLRSTGKEEPGVLALLAFGSLSGSVGATSVYPMNLVRTRMQASGSSGHPQSYTGPLDVATKTWQREGWRGFYRGLLPTLAKVVPAVSISYVVYEHSKRRYNFPLHHLFVSNRSALPGLVFSVIRLFSSISTRFLDDSALSIGFDIIPSVKASYSACTSVPYTYRNIVVSTVYCQVSTVEGL
ncbi:mitochondrial carrier [Lentinula boryana]|uniref:Mitochondrial carrier n=1 Tax=Lentinula boryana TaxID=40481 RepID=A0ABQ8QRR5_9AGAR|nr:mitochondrial carrier [Lentinula boryana]